MVARIVSGKSIRGILNYNENKVLNAEAEMLMAEGFPRGMDRLSFRNKLDRFDLLTRQNRDTRTNALHITLNFSNQDVVDNALLQQIARDYMERIGFGGQPYLVYRHYDAAHPHIHIASVNIADGGERIETHNIGRNQSERARKELEILYGLVKAEEQQKDMAYMLRPVNLERAVYGKAETKAAISSIVREVTGTYKFTSLPELNAVLRQFNVMAHPGEEGTRMREKGGLVYCLLDEKGDTVGIPIKASSIFGSPTLKNLQKKYQPNETGRRPYGQRLKHLLDKFIASSNGLDELQEKLRQQGIRIIMRENVAGQVYGVTFIDNATRAVFNGSDLGKGYGAKAFMERLPARSLAPNYQEQGYETPSATARGGESAQPYPAHDRPAMEKLLDIAFSGSHKHNMPDPFRRKKKKRIQPE